MSVYSITPLYRLRYSFTHGFTRVALLLRNRIEEAMGKANYHTQDYELLKSIPGIGTISALVLLSQIGEITRFRNVKAFCAYCGVVPSTRSSGEHVYQGHLIFQSDHIIRNILVEAIPKVIKKDEEIQSYYEHMKGCKGKNKARIACMHKLTKQIYGILLNKKPYTASSKKEQ